MTLTCSYNSAHKSDKMLLIFPLFISCCGQIFFQILLQGTLYSVALTLRLNETEGNMDKLVLLINTKKEILENITADIKEMSEKIKIVENDLI